MIDNVTCRADTSASPRNLQVQLAEDLEAAVEIANIPTLLMVLVQLTGELRWLDPPYTLSRTKGMDDNDSGGLAPDLQEEVRAAALAAILDWKSGTPMALPRPPDDLIVRMLAASMGDTVPLEYGPLLAEVLRLEPEAEAEAVAYTVPEDFHVAIIGSGISGIAAGIRLQQLGVSFSIFERNSHLGGSWLENHYPGAGVDTPSHLYQYSFLDHDWTMYFAQRDEVLSYIETVAADYDVLSRISFSNRVVRALYVEAEQRWRLEVEVDGGPDAGGSIETMTANVVISAVGTFNSPAMPDIDGLENFRGPCFHTARWPNEVDLRGKRVGVLGTGASAMQVVPAIVGTVSSLHVFQRSPQWAQPFPKHLKPIPPEERLLSREVPLYYAWQRARFNWIFHDKLHDSLQKDPNWPHPERSLNATNDRHREYFTRYIESEIAGREDLLPKVIPTYPPFGKRMLLDNGGWFRTLTRDNVHLLTDSVERVTATSVITSTGEEHELDVLVLATGFDCIHYLSTLDVVGRSDRHLAQEWNGDDGCAYLGLAIPGFPNLFTLYGPNTQPGHGGSLIWTVERQLHYIESLLVQMFAKGLGSVECNRDVYDRYRDAVDEAHANMVWTHPGMSTYYRNGRGRVVVNMPFRNMDYWRMTERADLGEYTVRLAGDRTASSDARS